jgi:hypothetical protein
MLLALPPFMEAVVLGGLVLLELRQQPLRQVQLLLPAALKQVILHLLTHHKSLVV